MVVELERHIPAIRVLCVRHGVRRLDVFGSAARDDFDPRTSDIDLIVEFDDRGWLGSFKRYMGLKLDLEDLLGRPVDLVELGTATNPYFVGQLSPDRRPIYAA